MKIYQIISSGFQAHMISQFLQAHGLSPQIHGGKEYASIVTGMDQGRYEIHLPEDEHQQADKLLRDLNNSTPPGAPNKGPLGEGLKTTDYSANSSLSSSQALKRSVFFALISSLLLPVIFNISSLYYLTKWRKLRPAGINRLIVSILILLLNGSMLATFYFLVFPALF